MFVNEETKKDTTQDLKKKQNLIKIIVLAVMVLAVTFVAKNDYGMYKTPIGRVISCEEKVTSGKKDIEKAYVQTLKIKIKNTSNKGKVITVKNKYTQSRFQTTGYSKGQDVFLNTSGSGDISKASVQKVKLDYITIFLIALFIAFTIYVAKRQTILILLSVGLNIVVFTIGLNGYAAGKNLIHLTAILTLVFIFATVILLFGFSRKSIGTIFSSIGTVAIVALIYAIIVYFSPELNYEYVPYTIGFENIEVLYDTGLLFGILGAVMDVAITINAAVCELIRVSTTLTMKKLINSIQEIAYDIMGTMINVVFFTFICGEIPVYVLKMLNGYSFIEIMKNGEEFEIIRFLVGALGIVLAIPVSGVIAVLVNHKGFKAKKEDK
ncbi:Uncharacterized membrane protein [Lachnospiraceae bacterium C7]|nr:Uncharacterized membrane protein [Lachnospiraceae bacterium C7]